MTTLTASTLANVIALELQDFRENHEYEKNQAQAAIAKGDFVRASRSMHESMIWQYNQTFADYFNAEKLQVVTDEVLSNELETVTASLLSRVLSTEINPRPADLAQQDAWKEQYKFCVRIQKIIARRAAQA